MSDSCHGLDYKGYLQQTTDNDEKEESGATAVVSGVASKKLVPEGAESPSSEESITAGSPQTTAVTGSANYAHEILSHVIGEAVRSTENTPVGNEEPDPEPILSANENEFQEAANDPLPGATLCLDALGSFKEPPSGSNQILNVLSSSTGNAGDTQVNYESKVSDEDSGLELDSLNLQVSSYKTIPRTSTGKIKTEVLIDSSEININTEETDKERLYSETSSASEDVDASKNTNVYETAKENVAEIRRESTQSSESVGAAEYENSEEENLDSEANLHQQEAETSTPASVSTTPNKLLKGSLASSAQRDLLFSELARETPSSDKLCATVVKELSQSVIAESGKEYDLFWSTVGLLRNYKDPMRPRREDEVEFEDEGESSVLAKDDEEVKAAICAIDTLFPGAELENEDDDDGETDDEPVKFVTLQKDDEENEKKGEQTKDEMESTTTSKTANMGDATQSVKDNSVLSVSESSERKKSLSKRLSKFLSKKFTTTKKKKKLTEATPVNDPMTVHP